jgi:hypothetical protein
MLDIPITDFISLLILIIGNILAIIVAIRLYQTYRTNKQVQTLIFALAAFFVAFAILPLILEKVFLSELAYNGFLAFYIFGPLAVVFSGFAVLFIDIFSYKLVFPKKTTILSVISAAIIAIYLGFWVFDPTRHIDCQMIGTFQVCEITFGNLFGLSFKFTQMLSLATMVPLVIIGGFVFFHFARKTRKYYKTRSNKALLYGLGQISLAVAYSTEIIGMDPNIAVVLRIFWIIGAVLFYWAIFRLKEEE